MKLSISSIAALLVAGFCSAPSIASDDIPTDLVVDVRVFEARSTTPDFKAMESLGFFINTDGDGVTEGQWLATIARQATDSFLATLAFVTVALDTPTLEISLEKRTRQLKLAVDLSDFVPQGVFMATVNGELARRDEVQRAFEQSIEVRLGQTFVWSGRDLELSASEYLSHFRDYKDGDDRRELYQRLRNYTTFIIVAITPRLAGARDSSEVVAVEVPDDASIPTLQSPIGIELVGTVELELDIDDGGKPADARVVRSSIPEVNSQILGAAATWTFPDARGKTGRMVLELKASP